MQADPSRGQEFRPIAVSMGDPAGIGLDIILHAHASRRAPSLPRFVVYGDPAALAQRASMLGLAIELIETYAAKPWTGTAAASQAIPVVPVHCAVPVVAGSPAVENGAAVIASIEQATAAVVAGTCSALVTAPISKATVYGAGFNYPGHTEFLAALAERHLPGQSYTSVMMIASEVLRVVPLTVHVPLASVPALITPERVTTVLEIVHAALRTDFAIDAPRIALSGLNPHAGEAGTIGREEEDIIIPAIERLRSRGIRISGPLSADTLFHAAARATYDVAVCMYHDQALIPIKTLAFDTGVNVTLGLPFVRTSPDHGTAFGIAGSGRASAESFVAALKMAHSLAEGRLGRRP